MSYGHGLRLWLEYEVTRYYRGQRSWSTLRFWVYSLPWWQRGHIVPNENLAVNRFEPTLEYF